MFERLSDRARTVMALANQEAHRLNHDFIGTEHILLGIVAEGKGVGACVLENLEAELAKVRLEVEKLVKPGSAKPAAEKLPQTPRAKKVIEYGIEECRRLNSRHFGTEHLLLGILREGEGLAFQALRAFDITLDKAREETMKATGLIKTPLWPFRLPEKLYIDRTADPLFVYITDDEGIMIDLPMRIELAEELVRCYNQMHGSEAGAEPNG